MDSIKGYLNKNFSMKDLGEAAYMLGIKIYRDRSRHRVIQISVKVLHRRNYLRRTLCHLHHRETFPYSTKDIFDCCLVIHSWIAVVPPWQTHGKAHNRSSTHHDILYRTYGWGIGNEFHSLSIFCRGRVLTLTQLHTLQLRQELLLWPIHFELLQNLIKVCTHRKSYQASWSIFIDHDAQYVSFTEVFLWKTPFKHSFMLSRKSYIISDQQYVIHIYLSERL